jgi:hypothetical protein
MIDVLHGDEPLVAFVGAGASALPPSSLPTWKEFNTLLVEALCERVAEFSGERQPTTQMLAAFRQRRDHTRFFAPDFQAQLMEEEIGHDYFRVWQSLDTDVTGPVHAGLAELASRGRLAAIITTNFDRLIETALLARGNSVRVFHDPATFEGLATTADGDRGVELPIIKIHGTIEDTASLVDTLRQRLVPRPESLLNGIQRLLRRHPWLYLGFSGADFSYNPRYLGILDAASDARGFVFLQRVGTPVEAGVRALVEAYGPEKASIVHGDLSTWLSETFVLRGSGPLAAAASNDDVTTRVKERIAQWVNGMGSIAVVNILFSMLRSSGMEADALWLLRKTWKSYRSAHDTQGRSYVRFNYNLGVSLLDTGFIRNPVTLAEDLSNTAEWREQADQNAFEYFARSYKEGNFVPAGAGLARVLAYRGEVGRAIALAADVTDEALARKEPLGLCDVAIASATLYDIVQMFSPAVVQLDNCVRIAEQAGDEPRRAMLCTHLGRFLTYRGDFPEADKYISEADRIARRLDLRSVLLASEAARGLWLAESGSSVESAVQTLQNVLEAIHALDAVPLYTRIDPLAPEQAPVVTRGRRPILCRVLLDLNRAAMFAGNADVMHRTLDELDELVTDVFLGYCPHYYLAYAQCLLTHGEGAAERATAAQLIGNARRMGERSQNPWVAAAANHLETEMERA